MSKTMTEVERKAYTQAEATPWARVRAYVVIKGDKWGKVQFILPTSTSSSGTVKGWVWDSTGYAGCGQASGYGYAKDDKCMAGIQYDDVLLKDSGTSWRDQLRNAGYTVIRAN